MKEYKVKLKYSIKYPSEKLQHHKIFPDFFIFDIAEKTEGLVWLIDDVESPEIDFDYGKLP